MRDKKLYDNASGKDGRPKSGTFESGLPGRSEIKGYRGLIVILYMTIGLFKTLHVIREGLEEFFGVLRGQNDTAFNLALGPARHYTDEIHYELGYGMINYREV
jgi:hypothetical protein